MSKEFIGLNLKKPEEKEKLNSFLDNHKEWFGKEAQLFQSLRGGVAGVFGAFIAQEILKQFGADLPPGFMGIAFAAVAFSKYSFLQSSRNEISEEISKE